MKKILLGICIAAMLLTIPSIYSRVVTEEENKTIETTIPYATVHNWLVDYPELDVDAIHQQLLDNGIDSVAVEAETLSSLQQRGMLNVVSVSLMKQLLIFNELPELEHPFDKDGIFIYSDGETSFGDITRNVFSEAQPIRVNNTIYTFVPGNFNELMNLPIGYDTQLIDTLLDAGFNVIPRLGDHAKPEVTERMIEELIAVKQDGVETVIFNGKSVPFGLKNEGHEKFGEQLKEAGYTMGWIEFLDEPQIGFDQLAYKNDLNVVRLHSRQVTTTTIVDDVEVYVRAFKERNIRMAFVNLADEEYEEAMTTLETFNTRLESKLPDAFTRGQAVTFDKVEIPLWQKLIGLIGLVSFLGFVAELVFKRRKLTYVALAGLSLLAILYLFTGEGMILKALALGLAIAAPIAAVLLPKDPTKKLYLVRSYAASIALVLLGVWFVVVLLNGNAFYLGIDQFRGVSLVNILPIAFLVLYALWENLPKLLRAVIAYWHIVVIAVLGGIILFYIGRGGNEGMVIPYELQFRLWLEETLYVRPRTKEFLIGLPLLVLAFHIAKTDIKSSFYVLIPAVIGVLSIMNTFTHLHIPLSISLLRTGYSVVLGFLIGLVFIVIYEYLKKVILREWARKRWVR
ncbi:DUF5693 family protein [Chryseomicrobium sp. FSL W7-1435]|uniref:DUF5693 family protein n=1 Tax=Chryseomicrobium sp. FSL W7-1435 TaxID=2921704 RepID=UPI00315A8D9E